MIRCPKFALLMVAILGMVGGVWGGGAPLPPSPSHNSPHLRISIKIINFQ